jgi:hypothetical protein
MQGLGGPDEDGRGGFERDGRVADIRGIDHALRSGVGEHDPCSPVTSAAAIRELRPKPGGELQVPGSGVLVRWLLENDRVDQIVRFTVLVELERSGRAGVGKQPSALAERPSPRMQDGTAVRLTSTREIA